MHKEINFDFNNMMSSSIGSEHGVLGSDLDEIKGVLNNAHEHLYAVIKDERIRIKQGLEWTQLPYQDKKLIKELKERSVCPCGEKGEFHTLVVDGPIFKKPIKILKAETIIKEGFWRHWFLDIKEYN